MGRAERRQSGWNEEAGFVYGGALRSLKGCRHGLFSQEDEPIDLDLTANEISNHPGIIWTHVMSLHREDAERLNYANAEAWKSLIRRNMIAIAEAHKIDVTNLKWVAAFHNTTNHPHCHLMVYSADAKQGYLTNKGIESIRRTMGQDIFRQEMHHLFKMETHLRDELKLTAKKTLQDYIEQSRQIRPANESMQQLFEKLISGLSIYQGKKVYGYLPKPVKATVNEIVRELAKDDRIASFYKEWNRVNHQKLSLYYEKEKPVTPLEDNKEFKSIKNAIIRAASEIMENNNFEIKSATSVSGTAFHSAEKDLSSGSFKVDSAVCSLIQSLGRMFQNSCEQKWDTLKGQVDSKLASKIAQKKLAHGIRLGSERQPEMEEDNQYQQRM